MGQKTVSLLGKLVDEHLASPQGEGLTRPQAFAHVAVRTDQPVRR
jgi:hypothetical protein